MAAPLPLIGMTEQELNGVLFVEFPPKQTLAESRQMLERMIRRNGDAIISPGTIYTAFFALRWRTTENTPGPVVEAKRERLRPGRFPLRYVENGADPNDPNALKWNTRTKTAERAKPRPTAEDWSFE